MPLPIVVTYTFGNATTSIPLSQLDSNFTTVVNAVNGIGNGTNALSNVSITGGAISALTTPLSAANGGTGLSSPGTSGNVLVSNGSAWQSSPTSGLNTAIQGAFKNLKVQVTGNSTCNVSCDQIVLYNGSLYSTQSTVSVSISTGSAGANGIETGTSLTQATWYYVWLIYNGTAVAGLLSASSTAPTLPSGYTYYARVGVIRTAAASTNLLGTLQYGRRTQYTLGVAGLGSSYPQIVSAANTSITAASVSSTVPPTGSVLYLFAQNNQNSANLGIYPNSSGSGTNTPFYWSSIVGLTPQWNGSIILESTNIYYYSSAGTLTIYCYGWEDNL